MVINGSTDGELECWSNYIRKKWELIPVGYSTTLELEWAAHQTKKKPGHRVVEARGPADLSRQETGLASGRNK